MGKVDAVNAMRNNVDGLWVYAVIQEELGLTGAHQNNPVESLKPVWPLYHFPQSLCWKMEGAAKTMPPGVADDIKIAEIAVGPEYMNNSLIAVKKVLRCLPFKVE